MTQRVRCRCKRVLFHVADHAVIEIKCRCGDITRLDLSPKFQPSTAPRPHSAEAAAESSTEEPRERPDRQEGPEARPKEGL